MSRICLIDGHPDATPERFCHALVDAYQTGARAGGHEVQRIDIAALDIQPLASAGAFALAPPEPVRSEREKIAAADHVCLIFPLWLGSMPSKTRAFFEHAACGQFLLATGDSAHAWPKKMMKGKSARIIITMGMPGFAYRLFFDAGSLKALQRGLFGVSGFKPVRHTIFGGVDAAGDAGRRSWLQKVNRLGEDAE